MIAANNELVRGWKVEELLVQEPPSESVATRQVFELRLVEAAALAGLVHKGRTHAAQAGDVVRDTVVPTSHYELRSDNDCVVSQERFDNLAED